MQREVIPGFGREVGEGASSRAAWVNAGGVLEGERVGAHESGGLMEVQAVADVGRS